MLSLNKLMHMRRCLIQFRKEFGIRHVSQQQYQNDLKAAARVKVGHLGETVKSIKVIESAKSKARKKSLKARKARVAREQRELKAISKGHVKQGSARVTGKGHARAHK